MTAKTPEEYFRDWEAHVFGFGYGTGEEHTLRALKDFMTAVGFGRPGYLPNSYDYTKLEAACGQTVAWLLINTLSHAGYIDYGTSPRFGWLTDKGMKLKEFIDARSAEELVNICCDYPEGYIPCYPDGCNCGPSGYAGEGVNLCQNPFWAER